MRDVELPSGLIGANWGLFGPIGAYSLPINSNSTPIGQGEHELHSSANRHKQEVAESAPSGAASFLPGHLSGHFVRIESCHVSCHFGGIRQNGAA